jgi:tetratricopeptide (TPR) repeat protein
MIPEQSERGVAQLAELWENAPASAAQATADSIDYLAPEIERALPRLPVEILFLRGMAARSRNDETSQRRYFGEVWSRGRHGYIFAVAAHYYGQLERDLEIAERALNDSLRWDDSTSHRIKVKNSLGKRLSKDRNRWPDAEAAYNESIELDREDPVSQAMTLHSLGQLLTKDRRRWDDAEKALNRSLQQRDNPSDEAYTYHSLGKLLSEKGISLISCPAIHRRAIIRCPYRTNSQPPTSSSSRS